MTIKSSLQVSILIVKAFSKIGPKFPFGGKMGSKYNRDTKKAHLCAKIVILRI